MSKQLVLEVQKFVRGGVEVARVIVMDGKTIANIIEADPKKTGWDEIEESLAEHALVNGYGEDSYFTVKGFEDSDELFLSDCLALVVWPQLEAKED